MANEPPDNNPSGRQHERIKMRARLKMVHPAVGDLLVYTSDLSDGGLFIEYAGNPLPEVGELVRIQLQDVPVEAPVLTAKIVRKTEDGVGVMFVGEDQKD